MHRSVLVPSYTRQRSFVSDHTSGSVRPIGLQRLLNQRAYLMVLLQRRSTLQVHLWLTTWLYY